MARKGQRNPMATMAVPSTHTLGAWARANGYNPKTRRYTKTETPPRAVPGAHPGAHMGHTRQKVA